MILFSNIILFNFVTQRNFTASQVDVFLRDLSGLNLSKYLSEVASALTEVKLKITDIPAAIQFCSQIHCTYAEFSSIFQEQWLKTLHFKKNDTVIITFFPLIIKLLY